MPHMGCGHDADDSSVEPIAIVGMACRLPGAVNSASSLWNLLKMKGSSQTPKVPASRFNIDAYFHQNLNRPGSFNVYGGYFLDGDPDDFDPTLFNITPIEAMWMDPQQRKMLEVSYECLEAAGLTLDAVAGSNTGVFVGSFTSDYQQMSIQDPDFRHTYTATGVDPGIISNRIGNTFDLNGPSFTINTACSSSIYAIHNACNSLRAHDCEAAITGGVNLILTVDQHMNTAKLGILSPTSTCHTFDASADGYGRAEGAGALYLKRLSDAIHDGDSIRGVIRSSAVNTNGKVAGKGITHPSVKGQERVIRMAYENSNLDPSETAYVECHGTATILGDPIEVRAVSNAMNDTRNDDTPLLIGAMKPNIGHSEAASGIFAVMKAAMITESGIIPGVAGFKDLNPAIDEKGWNVKINADTTSWPADLASKRVSVSSFGYGGTNGHVVVEEVNALCPWYEHGKAKCEAKYDNSSSRPFLVSLSAHDEPTLIRNINAHVKIADQFYLTDLAYTLNTRRTKFSSNAYIVARESNITDDFSYRSFKMSTVNSPTKEVGLIFTGQGAQWPGMGVEAMRIFPSFLKTIRSLDQILQRLEPTPSWSLEEILFMPSEKTSINNAEIAQPICTAVQIGITDLLAMWNIKPSATVGHSSGEIAAAYAAGLLSAPEAIIVAFYRGLAVKHYAPSGTMLAVGLGVREIFDHLSGIDDVVVACENSPSSVTLSGTYEGIAKIRLRLDSAKIFAKELKTGKAYHSPQMDAAALPYDQLLTKSCKKVYLEDFQWRRPRVLMISSVTGEEIQGESIPTCYWSENLRNRVLFDTAVTVMTKHGDLTNIKCIVEVGPHSALAGPFKQICKSIKEEQTTYIPTLLRNSDCASRLMRTAGDLLLLGYPVDTEKVNDIGQGDPTSAHKKSSRPRMLVDLPPYQWNYDKKYWTEPRFSEEQRRLKHARHDLLGTRVVGLSEYSRVWRNTLRHKDVLWLRDHRLGNAAVFPAAAHMSLGIEALRQVCEDQNITVESVTLRDVAFKTALVIPDTDNGIEIQLRLQETPRMAAITNWYSFSVDSIHERRWTNHCEGIITANHSLKREKVSPVEVSELTQRVPARRWYDAFHRVGFQYGESFRLLSQIRTNSRHHKAAASVKDSTYTRLLSGESRYIVHPSTIDACLQLIIVSINAGLHKEMPWGVVPVNMEEISLWFPHSEAAFNDQAIAWTDEHKGRYFITHTKLMAENGDLALDVKSLRCVAYEAALPQRVTPQSDLGTYARAAWKPDISKLTTVQAKQVFPSVKSHSDAIGIMASLLHHKSPIRKLLVLGIPETEIVHVLDKAVSPFTSIVIADHSTERLEELRETLSEPSRITTSDINVDPSQWADTAIEPSDLTVVTQAFVKSVPTHDLIKGLKSLVSEKAIIFCAETGGAHTLARMCFIHGFDDCKVHFDLPNTSVVLARPRSSANEHPFIKEDITLFVPQDQRDSAKRLASSMSGSRFIISVHDISEFDSSSTKRALVYDLDGTLFMNLIATTFDGLKGLICSGLPILWLTCGVNQGKHVFGGMSQGFLRAIRSEQAFARISLLDVDVEENVESIAEFVLCQAEMIATKDSGEDTEFWLHNGVVYINRMIPNKELNDLLSTSSRSVEETVLSPNIPLEGVFGDDGLVFRPKHDNEEFKLLENEVKLCITMTNLESLTCQSHSARPMFMVGKVLEIGKSVNRLLLDQTVLTVGVSSFSTVVRVAESSCVLYGDLKAEKLMATLPSLCRIVDALIITAKVEPNEHVLVLPAPTSIVKATIHLAQVFGIRFTFVTREENTIRELIAKPDALFKYRFISASDVSTVREMLSGKSKYCPGVILAYDFKDLSQEVWRFAPSRTRFVLNDATLEEAPDILPYTRGASFLSAGVTTRNHDPEALVRLMIHSLNILQDHKSMTLEDAVRVDLDVLRDPKSVSALLNKSSSPIVKMGYGKDIIKVEPANSTLSFPPNAMYVLVGCLGGIGRSLITWMMGNGCKNFTFLSRSGADRPEAAQVVNEITKAGATANVFRVDVSSEKEVADVVAKVNATMEIRGVVHAAMVLQDGLFERMSYEQFVAAVAPKAQGAISLHKAFKDKPLDFFVMTSSISAVLGNPGQSNYCAGNSFLDTLAAHRTANGQAATSLALPMVLDVGVVAENEDLEASLTRKGMYGIDEQEMLRAFQTAMLRHPPFTGQPSDAGVAQVVLGLDPAALSTVVFSDDTIDPYWYNDIRFAGLRAAMEASNRASSNMGSVSDFTAVLKAASTIGNDAVIQAISLHVMTRCSSMLMTSMESFEFDGKPVMSYGLDSVIGAELRSWLFTEFGLDISLQRLLAPTLTFKALSRTVGEKLKALI